MVQDNKLPAPGFVLELSIDSAPTEWKVCPIDDPTREEHGDSTKEPGARNKTPSARRQKEKQTIEQDEKQNPADREWEQDW
jgi:hypothetical protein